MGNAGDTLMTIGQWFRIGIWTLLIIALVACNPLQELNVPAQQLSVPAGHYGDVLRFPDGKIFIQAGRFGHYDPDVLHYYVLSEERFVEIPFKDDPRCRLTEYGFPTALPDGRLGLSEMCHGRWPDRPIGQDNARYIVAYDWETGEMEQIVDAPLPYESGRFSWNPEITRGVQDIGSLIGTIHWLTPTGMEPMTIIVGTGEQSWSLDENLDAMYNDRLDDNDGSIDAGIARSPAWSPDGRFIAFWASSNVIGRSGMSRAQGAYELYLLDPGTLQLQQILGVVKNTSRLVWSPDSEWLAFTGEIGSSEDSLWLISADGSLLQSIDRGSDLDFYPAFNGWNWLNEQDIIATRCLDTNCDQSEVIKYDVSEIVNSSQE
jgi:hypothetical protein